MTKGHNGEGAGKKRLRSALPVARTTTGKAIRTLTNSEIQDLLDEEEAMNGHLARPSPEP